jgi:UDP-glucose 4-epimerase
LARTVVTGGAGFIGSHLVRALVARGRQVRVFDDLSTGRKENLEGVEAELVVGDILDGTAVLRALEEAETVYHLAAKISVAETMADPLIGYAVNLTGTLNVLRAAHQNRSRAVVLASSAAVYGAAEGRVREHDLARPISPYGASKLAMEGAAALFSTAYGVPTATLRLFNVYGPRQSPDSRYAAVIPLFIRQMLDGAPVTIEGDGKQTRDFVFVEDVARAMLAAAENPARLPGPLNIGTGRSVSIVSLARALQDQIPGAPPPVYGAARAGDIRHSASDIRQARSALGYRPEVTLEQGLRATVQWFRECQKTAAP